MQTDDTRTPHESDRRVAIVQSNYIPWKGYFDLIGSVDTFVLLDDVQYTRRDWRNRNVIKTRSGLHWLTVPVSTRGHYSATIREIEVADGSWAERHWKTIAHEYARTASFGELSPVVQTMYEGASALRQLSAINRHCLAAILPLLDIRTVIRDSSEFHLIPGRNERLVSICAELGASTYVTGPKATGYIDLRAFEENGIAVEVFDYSGYPEYHQPDPPFEHHVSIIDLLLNEGRRAPAFMKIGVRTS